MRENHILLRYTKVPSHTIMFRCEESDHLLLHLSRCLGILLSG